MKLHCEWDTAQNVFRDNNKGFKYGLFQSIDVHGSCNFVQWFKTKKRMMEFVEEHDIVLIN